MSKYKQNKRKLFTVHILIRKTHLAPLKTNLKYKKKQKSVDDAVCQTEAADKNVILNDKYCIIYLFMKMNCANSHLQ